MLDQNEKWVGPFEIRKMLESYSDAGSIPKPPESGSVYLVTKTGWKLVPSEKCVPLYIGGNTGNSARFRTRIGDLLADAFGFYTSETGHHSGGQRIHRWCLDERVNPLDLYIAWINGTECHRCLEYRLYRALNPFLNRQVPSKCTAHI